LSIENYIRYRNDPWAFLSEAVYTKDQVDRITPIKLFPNKDYLRFIARAWQKYPLIALPKTRRMTISWLTIGLYVWDTIFHQGRFNAFVSKKEDDANELVMRAKFIVDHIPEDKLAKDLVPKYHDKFNVLDFCEIDSKIQGFPQGADQLRQFTFSGIFGDESAFWDQAQAFYSASFPTIEGGGRMSLVSSPAPGFFKKLVFDALDVPGDINVAEYTPDFKQAMQGLRFWTNKRNRFLVIELHYTADPAKRAVSFRESIRNSMPLMDYLREYELHWDTFEGQPVYPEFSKLHIISEPPTPSVGIPMLIGFDFGLTPAAVVAQFENGKLTIFKEYVEINMGAMRFVPKVIADIRMRWPQKSDLRKDWRCFIDPSGINRSDTDESSCAQVLHSAGFVPTPGPIAFEDRRKAVANFLMQMTKDGPAFQLYGLECPVLLKGFEGGYRFSEKAVDIEPQKLRPLKDAFSHPHDSLQYVCAGVRGLQSSFRLNIPSPTYGLTAEGSAYGKIRAR
jgi:hypothetical protein